MDARSSQPGERDALSVFWSDGSLGAVGQQEMWDRDGFSERGAHAESCWTGEVGTRVGWIQQKKAREPPCKGPEAWPSCRVQGAPSILCVWCGKRQEARLEGGVAAGRAHGHPWEGRRGTWGNQIKFRRAMPEIVGIKQRPADLLCTGPESQHLCVSHLCPFGKAATDSADARCP